MGVKIKLKKISKGSYKIIIVKKNSNFRGKVIEYLGSYTFIKNRNIWVVRIDKIVLSKWIMKGAEISDRVNKILKIK